MSVACYFLWSIDGYNGPRRVDIECGATIRRARAGWWPGFFSEFRMGRWRQGEIEEEQPCFWNELDAGSSTQILQIKARF
jgi:hypothetical protein